MSGDDLAQEKNAPTFRLKMATNLIEKHKIQSRILKKERNDNILKNSAKKSKKKTFCFKFHQNYNLFQ